MDNAEYIPVSNTSDENGFHSSIDTETDIENDIENNNISTQFSLKKTLKFIYNRITLHSIYTTISDNYFPPLYPPAPGENITYNDNFLILPPLEKDLECKSLAIEYKKFLHYRYAKYNERPDPSNILSMVFRMNKNDLICTTIYSVISAMLNFVAIIVFVVYLWPAFETQKSTIIESEINATVEDNFHIETESLEREKLVDMAMVSFAAAAVFACFAIKALFTSLSTQTAARVCCKIGSCALYLVYQKIITYDNRFTPEIADIDDTDDTSAAAKQKISPVNVIAQDVRGMLQNLSYLMTDGIQTLIFLFCTSVTIIIVSGWNGAIGVAFAFFIGIPLIFLNGLFFGLWQRKKNIFADKRIQLTKELLFGIRIVKCNAYELPLLQKIYDIRQQEMHCVSKVTIFGSFLFSMGFLLSPVMLFVILMSEYAVGYGLTSKVMVILVLLLSMFGYGVQNVTWCAMTAILVIIGYKRVNRFLEPPLKGNSFVCKQKCTN